MPTRNLHCHNCSLAAAASLVHAYAFQTHKDANMCDEMLYTLAMKMTQVEVVLRNLAMEVKAYQAGEATRQLVLGQVEEVRTLLWPQDVGRHACIAV